MKPRVLLLVRHAKAVADAATDAERPLSGRGRRDAAAAGKWLAEQGICPDLVVVSPAARARQTWEELAKAVTAGRVAVDERIYANTAGGLLTVLAEAPEEAAGVALVGHNPSMHALATALDDGRGEPQARTALGQGYPTCAVAVFEVPGHWRELAPGGATLRSFAVPRA